MTRVAEDLRTIEVIGSRFEDPGVWLVQHTPTRLHACSGCQVVHCLYDWSGVRCCILSQRDRLNCGTTADILVKR